jgi:hypothetical protein
MKLNQPDIICSSRPPTEKDTGYPHLTVWVHQQMDHEPIREPVVVYLRWQQSVKQTYWRKFIEDKKNE